MCLIPVGLAFLVMGSMMGENMKKKMAEYQNALEEMSSEAVEYVRGIPVVKTFGQSVFSFKRFREAIKNYEKWTISYTKDAYSNDGIHGINQCSICYFDCGSIFFWQGK